MDLNGFWPQTGVMTTATQYLGTVTEPVGHTVVSRHRTSQGDVMYVRCVACGALRMLSASGAAGHHGHLCPFCD